MNKQKTLFLGLAFVFALLVSLVIWRGDEVLGNPMAINRGCYLGNTSATGTVVFLSAGRATTTLACDLFNLTTSGAGGLAPNAANLALQMVGSSTNSTLDINVEYSNDGIDWYQDGLSDRSTTTPSINIGPVQNTRMQFSSTTAGLPLVSASQATTTRMITVQAPTRFVRAVFTVPAGAAASGIWAELTTRKEIHE